MFSWLSKKKKEALMLTQTTETMLPIPFATAAKQMSTDNLDARIKRAEKAILIRLVSLSTSRLKRVICVSALMLLLLFIVWMIRLIKIQ